MAEMGRGLNRRRFAKGLALAPLGLAGVSVLAESAGVMGQEGAAKKPGAAEQKVSTAPDAKANPQPEPKRRWQIYEEEHFSHPLVFERRDVKAEVEPFALREVTLAADGPYAQSRAWSRGFMLRIGTDRLLHNFRVTAGLPSGAVPLGGLEAPDKLLRGHWVGHYMSGCALLYGSTGDKEMKARGDAIVAGIARARGS